MTIAEDLFDDTWLTIQMGFKLTRDVRDEHESCLVTVIKWPDAELKVPNEMTARQIYRVVRAWYEGFQKGQKSGALDARKAIRLALGFEGEK